VYTSAVKEVALPSVCFTWHLKTSHASALVFIPGAYPILEGHHEGEKGAQDVQFREVKKATEIERENEG